MTRLEVAIRPIKQFEEVLMTQKKVIELVIKQGCILKKFKDQDVVEFSRSTIYFKKRFFKIVIKYTSLQNLTLSISYFKNNFKKIKSIFEMDMNHE